MEETKKNPLKDKSYTFALKIVFLAKKMHERKEFEISRQVLRSGTAIGALTEEANQAESKADFIHKLSIANKEANETHYWLRLLNDSHTIDRATAEELINDCRELEKLLTAIIKTAKENLKKKK